MGVNRYYRILYNTEFTEVRPTDLSVSITNEDIQLLVNNYDDPDLWKRLFPQGSWELNGFAIITQNTTERLTQAGKLVIVYASEAEEQEYLRYLSMLQQSGLLKNDLEQVIVEDLQDVSGLQAFRVSIGS
jgi:hypothetical protein